MDLTDAALKLLDSMLDTLRAHAARLPGGGHLHAVLLAFDRSQLPPLQAAAGTYPLVFGSAETFGAGGDEPQRRSGLIALLGNVLATMKGPPPGPRGGPDLAPVAAAMHAAADLREPSLSKQTSYVLIVAADQAQWTISFRSVQPSIGLQSLERFLSGVRGN